MGEKVNRIWTVLSSFEESAAASISDMLLNVSQESFSEAVHEAAHFIDHVEVLFIGLDDLNGKMKRLKMDEGWWWWRMYRIFIMCSFLC